MQERENRKNNNSSAQQIKMETTAEVSDYSMFQDYSSINIIAPSTADEALIEAKLQKKYKLRQDYVL